MEASGEVFRNLYIVERTKNKTLMGNYSEKMESHKNCAISTARPMPYDVTEKLWPL